MRLHTSTHRGYESWQTPSPDVSKAPADSTAGNGKTYDLVLHLARRDIAQARSAATPGDIDPLIVNHAAQSDDFRIVGHGSPFRLLEMRCSGACSLVTVEMVAAE